MPQDDFITENVSRETQEKFTRTVFQDFEESREYVQPKHKQYVEYLELFLNKPDPRKPKGVANCPVPLTREIITAVLADILDKLFGTSLRIDTEPRKEAQDLRNTANRDIIHYQSDVRDWRSKLRQIIFNILIGGVGPAKVTYAEEWDVFPENKPIYGLEGSIVDYVASEVEKMIYTGADLMPIDPLDFFPHQALLEIDDDLPIIHRFQISPTQLFRKRQRVVGDIEKGVYSNVNQILRFIRDKEGVPRESFIDEFKNERRQLYGLSPGLKDHGFLTCYEWQGPFDIDDDGLEEDCIGVVADMGNQDTDRILLRLEKNPYKHRRKGYICGRIGVITGEFWGIGLADAMGPQQDAATSLRNAILDAYYRLGRPRTYYREGCIADLNKLHRPWGDVEVLDDQKPIREQIMETAPIPIGSDGPALLNDIKGETRAAAGAPGMKLGQAPSPKVTATTGSQLFQAGEVIFKDLLVQLETSLILPMVKKANKINQQFLDRPYVIRVVGDRGVYWHKTVNPEDIAGEVNFVCHASMRHSEKAVLVEQLMKAGQVASSNQQLMPAAIIAYVEMWEAQELPHLELLKVAVGWYQMMTQLRQAQSQQIMPYQQMLLQEQQLGVNPQNEQQRGNAQPYVTSQQRTPTNQEGVSQMMNSGMIRNMPPQ